MTIVNQSQNIRGSRCFPSTGYKFLATVCSSSLPAGYPIQAEPLDDEKKPSPLPDDGILIPSFSSNGPHSPLRKLITQADKTHLSYRFALWQKLRIENVRFDFIGTMNTNYGGNPAFPDPAFDKDHEGHRGWRADQLLASLPSWLGGYTPDIVLLHVGTNDMFMGNSVT